ncbi:MAG: hypothetical protein ABI072_02835, partial [Edaphobacter sp.]
IRVKSGGTAKTLFRGPSLPRAANKFDLTSAGDISVVGDPAPKNKLIAHHVTACWSISPVTEDRIKFASYNL